MINRKRRKETRDRYFKTPNGFLRRLYDMISRRVRGKHKGKRHLYHGLPLCSREEFLEWAQCDTEFEDMLKTWKKHDYQLKYRPTVDRIDTRHGYIVTNMQWVTYSENSRRGVISRWSH